MVVLLAAPLYLAGAWHLYLGLRPAGPRAAVPPAIMLAWCWGLAPAVHGLFLPLGGTMRAMVGADLATQQALFALWESFQRALVVLYAPVLLLWAVAWTWALIPVARGVTHFPRWLAALHPLVLLIVFSLGGPYIPGPIGHLLHAGGSRRRCGRAGMGRAGTVSARRCRLR